MKKVLFFLESLAGGGAEKVLIELVNNLDKEKFDITVLTVVDTGVYREDVIKKCKYLSILKNHNEYNRFFGKLLYKIKYKLIYKIPTSWVYKLYVKKKYDIEIGFVEGFSTKFIAHSYNTKSKKIAWVHVDPINRDYADNYYRNNKTQVECYKKYNSIVCVSNSVKQAFEQKMYEHENIIVQYNPVDREMIINRSKEIIEQKKPEKILIGTVGRLTNQKGYDRLLKVCKKLMDDGLEFELWIIGDGLEKNNIKQYITENNMGENIKMMGFQKNPYNLMNMCDLFVCSSRAEGFSLAIAESLILGIPIISTNCAGPNELLGHGKYGLIVENNENSLYEGLKILLTDEKMRNDFKNKSMERQKIFEVKPVIKEIEQILM
ncbi:glycosyltransferase [Peribacillus sp. NPDC097284]|uniref:glycosyltransferase n=1 Tax=Peribacillus sp. NPDC097284 TaxID=3364401 RepID=UPI003826E960